MTTLYIGGRPRDEYGNSWSVISSTNYQGVYVSKNSKSLLARCRITGIEAAILRESIEGRLLEKGVEGSSNMAVAECVTKLVMNNATASQLENAVNSIRLAAYLAGKKEFRQALLDLLEIST
jgi:hypothetical protein